MPTSASGRKRGGSGAPGADPNDNTQLPAPGRSDTTTYVIMMNDHPMQVVVGRTRLRACCVMLWMRLQNFNKFRTCYKSYADYCDTVHWRVLDVPCELGPDD